MAARAVLAFSGLLLAFAVHAADAPHETAFTLGNDRFLAGDAPRIGTPVHGDAIAAGGHVAVESAVDGDAVIAGGEVRIDGNVAHNVYAAGGRVLIDAPIGGNVRAAGGRVEVGPRAELGRNGSIVGGEVRVSGTVKGYLQLAGGTVVIDGPVGGDVVANGGRVELGPHARIAGKLVWRGRELQQDPAAQVAQGVERVGPVKDTSVVKVRHGGRWLWTVGLVVLAVILTGALPGAERRISGNFRTHPWLALLLGFVAFVGVPVAAVVLLLTLIGIPLGLLVLLLYPILLILGYVAAAVAIGIAVLQHWEARAMQPGWRMFAALAAVVALGLVTRIPYLGTFIGLVVMLFGVGAILLALRRQPAPAPAVP